MPTPPLESDPSAALDDPRASRTSGVPSALFAKLLVLVIALIGTGAALLTIRHQRLETMHRIAETREEIDRELARQRTLEARIAELLHPDELRQRLQTVDIGPWVPRPEDDSAPASSSDLVTEPSPPRAPIAPRFAPQWALDRETSTP